MKLNKLRLKNLNSFREVLELDFEKSPLDEASLVAITGPTGAGKTTLLDAICVALYGKTPRLSGTGTQNPSHLITHGEKEGYAEVHFVANSTRYLAEWSMKRKNSPKGQLFNVDENKLITNRLGAKGKSLGSSQKTVSEEIESILGLSFDAFKRSVMLAQGEFAAFLKAKDEDRRTILEATAGIGIYDELKKGLNDKVRRVKTAYEAVSQKLNAIPEVTQGQFAEAQTRVDSLYNEAEALQKKREESRRKEEREQNRAEAFEKLCTSQKRYAVLLDEAAEIAEHETEREQARLANNLRSEKQALDFAISQLSDVDTTFRKAEIECEAAQTEFEQKDAQFTQIDGAYQAELQNQQTKMKAYAHAKSDVKQAQDRHNQAESMIPQMEELAAQINNLSKQLTEDTARHAELHQQIQATRAFLDENSLPVDRQPRLISAKEFLGTYREQHKRQQEKSERKTEYVDNVKRLKGELTQLSQAREELTAEKVTAEASLARINTELAALQTVGTLDLWHAQKEKAQQALPIAQRYEVVQRQLDDVKHEKAELHSHLAIRKAALEAVNRQLESQAASCAQTAEKVTRFEHARELALLAAPINQLRQQLEAGKPCRVCGATEHPCADEFEPEGDELLEAAEKALATAKTDALAEQKQMQRLERKKAQLEQDENNLTTQIDTSEAEIDELESEAQSLSYQWQEIYLHTEVTAAAVEQQLRDAETAIENLHKAREACTNALHDYETRAQHLESCEKVIARENELLKDTQQNLQVLTDELEDLKAEMASSENRFWELMPNTFHQVEPEKAVSQFENQIETVEAREQECSKKIQKLERLESEHHRNEREHERLTKQHQEVKADIKRYQCEENQFLDAARDKTDGLTTEQEIDTKIEKLEAAVQKKANQRNEAEQEFQESKISLAQAQTNYEYQLSRRAECTENVEIAREAYLKVLNRAGFDSPEAHENAFREEGWMQQVEKDIKEYNREKHALEVEIAELQTRFEETPFEPQKLEEITARRQEIEQTIETIQKNIGAEEKKIEDFGDALSKREAFTSEIEEAERELNRWDNLQQIIPANDLRDFALDIMFKQVARIANAQLEYLTSERYQLKVESIGKLTVIDRWNANEERPVETLSGGESFLTSLALALALSELSRGRTQLSSLFLDEGFGTLDAETLDVAIAALEGLRMQGKSIFLISHIQELTRRLPVKINVRKRGNGCSYIQISS